MPENPLFLPPSPRDLLKQLKGSTFVVGFDFDGTLVELATRPEGVLVPDELGVHLQTACRLHRVAICTGRAPRDLMKFIPECPGLDVIGNHGLEWHIWKRDGGQFAPEYRDLTPSEWPSWRMHFLKELKEKTAKHGGDIEDKIASLTLHYRNSGSEYWSGAEGRKWLESRMGVNVAQMIGGKAAWNLLPVGASKGEAMIRYAREFGFDHVIYFGDEPTDESVFIRQEVDVIGVKVGEGDTAARYRLPDVTSVRAWLKGLAEAENS